MKRVFLIVLDSCGVGYEPDAADFGDVGANTLHTCSQSPKFAMPNLISMGLGNLDGVDYLPKTNQPQAALARLQELSRGKDTTIGHWEIAGLVSPQPLPTFPHGFPEEILKPFSEQTGRGVLCNLPYSGTEVIKDYGREHVKTSTRRRTPCSRSQRMSPSFRPSSFMNIAASRGNCLPANTVWAASLPVRSRANGRIRARPAAMISRLSHPQRPCLMRLSRPDRI